MFKKLLITVTALTAIILGNPTTALAATPKPVAVTKPAPNTFKAGNIITDKEFYNNKSWTAKQIQTFLNNANSKCADGYTCLKNYKTNTVAKKKDNYCGEIKATKNITAANLIHQVANACKINPQVILTMLQKEQSLVTATKPSKLAYQRAMGQACPDTGPNNSANCDANAAGFFNQVYAGTKQLQIYTKNPTKFRYQKGKTNSIQWSTKQECGTSNVYIENQATANLYNYTPYRPNIAALTTLSGTGDACSTYGNRNFFVYYTNWFKPKTPAKTIPNCTTPPTTETPTLNRKITLTTPTKTYAAPTVNCTTTTTIPKNATLTFTHKYGEWAKATYNKKTVWAKLGTPTTSCPIPTKTTKITGSYAVYNATKPVNARQAPSTECTTKLTTLPLGTIVTSIEKTNQWIKIKTSTGTTHWVTNDYLTTATKTTPLYKTNNAVNFRSKPTTQSTSYKMLAKNLHVGKILQKEGKWAKITLGTQTGWVHTDYLVLHKR